VQALCGTFYIKKGKETGWGAREGEITIQKHSRGESERRGPVGCFSHDKEGSSRRNVKKNLMGDKGRGLPQQVDGVGGK